jgi:hypothetical protein
MTLHTFSGCERHAELDALEDFALVFVGYILVFDADDLFVEPGAFYAVWEDVARLFGAGDVFEEPAFACHSG